MLLVKEVADRLAVHPETVRNWIKSRELRGLLISINRRSRKPEFRVAESDLATFIAARTVGPAPARPTARRRDYERIV